MSKPEPAITAARRGSAALSEAATSFTSYAGDIEKNLSALDVSATTLKGLHPNDPLLWSKWKKLTVLAVLCYVTFLTDFLAGYSVPMTIAQQKDWNLSYVDASRNLSGNTFVSPPLGTLRTRNSRLIIGEDAGFRIVAGGALLDAVWDVSANPRENARLRAQWG